MMKKVLAIFLATTVVAGLAACGNTAEATTEEITAATTEETEVTETEEPEVTETADTEETAASESEDTQAADVEDSAATGNALVVYYSATGNTENVANLIAEITGGELFELLPVEPYTDEDLDWTNNDSRVSAEHNDESLRNVELASTTVPDWDSYDTVYIGYPIWWGIAAWPVNGFVGANNFEGKTVIPFSTAASSGIGESGELLEAMAGTGQWLDGECFRGSVSLEDVQAWIDSL